MATTFEDWQSAYPALSNLNFGKNSLTGGSDLFSGFNGLGQPAGMQSLPANNGTGLAPSTAGTGMGLGWNMNTAQLGLGALQTVGGLYNAFQGNKLARQQFNFTRDFANTNLNNSIQSYNTQLADRARSRAAVEGQSDAERDQYINDNRLSRS
ncbi:hypothetical protein [Xanthomonas virus PB119]|nr:hypothetical protein [Xanthomonas virus PB119]